MEVKIWLNLLFKRVGLLVGEALKVVASKLEGRMSKGTGVEASVSLEMWTRVVSRYSARTVLISVREEVSAATSWMTVRKLSGKIRPKWWWYE